MLFRFMQPETVFLSVCHGVPNADTYLLESVHGPKIVQAHTSQVLGIIYN